MSLEFDFSELEQKLNKIEKKMAKDITEKALKSGADIVLETQKYLIPVKTGELRNAAQISKFTRSTGECTVYIGFPKESGRRNVEIGWFQNRGVRGRPGLFFMEESLEVSRASALERIIAEIRRGLEG